MSFVCRKEEIYDRVSAMNRIIRKYQRLSIAEVADIFGTASNYTDARFVRTEEVRANEFRNCERDGLYVFVPTGFVDDARGREYHVSYTDYVSYRTKWNSGQYPYSKATRDAVRDATNEIVSHITPTNVIFNGPATIVQWEDGTKTVVKCKDGDYYDPEKGFMMAMLEKMYGSKTKVKKILTAVTEDEPVRENNKDHACAMAYKVLVNEMEDANADPNYIPSYAAIEEAIGYLGEVLCD